MQEPVSQPASQPPSQPASRSDDDRLDFTAWAPWLGRHITEDGARVHCMFQDWRKVNIFEIAVPDRLRGQGIGTRLLAAICAQADRDGVTLTLLPLPDNPSDDARLRAWYARHGFVAHNRSVFGIPGMIRHPKES